MNEDEQIQDLEEVRRKKSIVSKWLNPGHKVSFHYRCTIYDILKCVNVHLIETRCMFLNLRICSCLAGVYRVMDALGKFGEHEKCVRVARGAAESNSSFLSALQTSQVHP